MPRSERDEVISKLVSPPHLQRPCTQSSRIRIHYFSTQMAMVFSAMMSDLVMDTTLEAHYEAQKSDVLCDICHTRYASDIILPARFH